MRMARKPSGRIGSYIATTTSGETVRAYLPPPLPPTPPLDLPRLLTLIERANQALGRLDGMTAILPSTKLFVFMYVRKEALLSSQIEGTQSSLSDLLLFENEESSPRSPRRRAGGLELHRRHEPWPEAIGWRASRSRLRLIKEMHRELAVEGARRAASSLANSAAVRTGSAARGPATRAFVPPPPERVMASAWSDLERFLHERTTVSRR